MSAEIIVPEGLRPFGRESDFVTRAHMRHEIIMVFGPIAQLVTELCERVQVIEDHLGIIAPDKNAAHVMGNCDGCGNGWDFCECAHNQRQQSTSGDIE